MKKYLQYHHHQQQQRHRHRHRHHRHRHRHHHHRHRHHHHPPTMFSKNPLSLLVPHQSLVLKTPVGFSRSTWEFWACEHWLFGDLTVKMGE